MGGGDSVEYRTDPALLEKIINLEKSKALSEKKFQDDLNQIRAEHKKEMKKITDPEKIVELKEMQMKQYLQYLSKKKWSESLTNNLGVKHNVVVGNISVGKSSLLNYLFNLKLEVGVGETTVYAEPVRKGPVTVWDSPGIN